MLTSRKPLLQRRWRPLDFVLVQQMLLGLCRGGDGWHELLLQSVLQRLGGWWLELPRLLLKGCRLRAGGPNQFVHRACRPV